jgi:superfamily II DNA or RNA helicase
MTGTGTLALRDYQVEAVEKLEKGWADGRQRLAVVLPTGTGKTVTFAGLAARFMERTGENVAVIAHRDELISQAASKFHQVAPGYSVGVGHVPGRPGKAGMLHRPGPRRYPAGRFLRHAGAGRWRPGPDIPGGRL